jgi:hypothetical protein
VGRRGLFRSDIVGLGGILGVCCLVVGLCLDVVIGSRGCWIVLRPEVKLKRSRRRDLELGDAMRSLHVQ